MQRITYDTFQQNTRLWDLVRMGIPTTSCFADVLRVKGRGEGGASITRESYLHSLAGELWTGQPQVTYRNAAMDRGHALQEEAVQAYLASFDTSEALVTRPAFIRMEDGNLVAGCSPDVYVKTTQQGGAEIKTLDPKLMVKLALNPDVPPQHLPQIYGAMLVTGAEWWDFVAYCPGTPFVKKRVWRDAALIADIDAGLRQFNRELESIMLRITGETLRTHRNRLAERFKEALAEELREGEIDATVADGAALAGRGDEADGSAPGIVGDLKASVERENLTNPAG